MMTTRCMSTISLVLLGLAACPGNDGDDGDLPEPTTFEVSVQNVGVAYPYFASGSFDTPDGADAPGPLLPGQRYRVSFHAPPGSSLSFATMFMPSNDLFFAPADEGIALFDQGQPRAGDVTAEVMLWDAGTELDQDLGLGDQQAPRQGGANTGDADPNPSVRPAADSYAGLPEVSTLIGVTLDSDAGNGFVLTIENRSDDQSLMLSDGTSSAVPLSPGVFVIHSEPKALFAIGEATRAAGLEALAEDGDPTELLATLTPDTGLIAPLAPGIWLVHEQGEPLFQDGQPDLGLGLEVLAEDGSPDAALAAFPETANVGTFGGVYGGEVGPLGPGLAFVFEIQARPGERLSFASMFAQSNDVFYAFSPQGVALFDDAGVPIGGDLSGDILLWDLGTEVNEYPGAGPNQAPRQAGPNTGVDENGVVSEVDDGFVYPSPSSIVHMTIEAQ